MTPSTILQRGTEIVSSFRRRRDLEDARRAVRLCLRHLHRAGYDDVNSPDEILATVAAAVRSGKLDPDWWRDTPSPIAARPVDDTTAEILIDGVAVGMIEIETDELREQHVAPDYRRIRLRTRAYDVTRSDTDRGIDPHVLDVSISVSGTVRFTIGDDTTISTATENGWA